MDSPVGYVADKEASPPVGDRPGVCASVKDLPAWDVILNAAGGPLAGRVPPTNILVLGRANEQAGESPRVFVLSTQDAGDSAAFTSTLLHLAEKGYSVTDTLAATHDVIRVVLSMWESATTSTIRGVEDSTAHKWWDDVVAEAYRLGASDIHLRANRGRGDLLYRIDGELEPSGRPLTEARALDLAGSMYNTMTDPGTTSGELSALKPLSAPITRHIDGVGAMRLRFESLPVEPNGLNVTLRLIPLGAKVTRKSPASQGYSPDQEAALERMFSRSSGLILFVGPVGSGKSTSMANMLMGWVDSNPGKMLRTVEEPVEILIPGTNVSQSSVNRGQQALATANKKDSNDPFMVMLRSIVRSDLDAMMVGEIRDGQTAHLAIQGVRSGHLCVSTLHSDGALIAFDRLDGMGVPRVDLASVGLIAGIVFQRLVPVLCEACKRPARDFVDSPEHAAVLGRLETYMRQHPEMPDYLDHVYFRNPSGCEACRHRGVRSRTACAEILIPTTDMLEAIRAGDSVKLWKLWRQTIDPQNPSVMRGRTAFEHAAWKMTQGMLSPPDVERAFHFLDEESP
jgi:type II secretory ATPase GspE/PulE/Tfp pilus assembly ATPase PilB-like protein